MYTGYQQHFRPSRINIRSYFFLEKVFSTPAKVGDGNPDAAGPTSVTWILLQSTRHLDTSFSYRVIPQFMCLEYSLLGDDYYCSTILPGKLAVLGGAYALIPISSLIMSSNQDRAVKNLMIIEIHQIMNPWSGIWIALFLPWFCTHFYRLASDLLCFRQLS